MTKHRAASLVEIIKNSYVCSKRHGAWFQRYYQRCYAQTDLAFSMKMKATPAAFSIRFVSAHESPLLFFCLTFICPLCLSASIAAFQTGIKWGTIRGAIINKTRNRS